MISKFLKLYVEKLQKFSLEMNRIQQAILLSNNNVRTLALEVQEKFKQLFAEMIKKESLDSESMEENSQIKIIYLLMKQIQKINAEKRSLTRNACDLLDKYLESLDEHLKIFEINNDNDTDLLNTILLIKPVIRQPVGGKALVVDLIKQMENGQTKSINQSRQSENGESTSLNQSSQSDLMVVDDMNKNVEMLSENFIEGMLLKDMPSGNDFETKVNMSELIHRLNNLQHFTDKIFDICLEMRSR